MAIPLTDAEVLEQKYLIRDNYLSMIKLITSEPKPNYDIDGQKVMWADYLKLLQSGLAAIEAQIVDLLPPIDGEEVGYC